MNVSQPSKQDLGTSLRALRKQRELTIAGLAKQAEVHETYVSLIERGQANPTWEVLLAITTALNVKPSKLLAGAEAAQARRAEAEAEADPA